MFGQMWWEIRTSLNAENICLPFFLFKVLFVFNPQKDSTCFYTDKRDINEAEANPLVSQRTFDMLTIKTCALVLFVSDWVCTVGS